MSDSRPNLPDGFDIIARTSRIAPGVLGDDTPRSPRIRLIPSEGPNRANPPEPLSSRKLKSFRKSPSEYLTATLRRHGLKTNEHDLKPQRNKVDLSYVSPYKSSVSGTSEPCRRFKSKSNPFGWGLPDLDDLHQEHNFQPSLQSCTALCIEEAYSGQKGEPDWTGAIARSASLTEAYLETKGYDTSHLMTWAQILCAPTCADAARQLLEEGTKKQEPPVPLFILMFLLRRPDICAPALRDLYNHSLQQLRSIEEGRRTILDRKTAFVMFVRFLRAARNQWPEAITSITSLGLKYLRMAPSLETKKEGPLPKLLTPRRNIKHGNLTVLYNRTLALLALPLGVHPMAFVGYQQRAQFNVLRHMEDNSPRILLTQEGYRALARVQLGHMKTDQERNWALLKSKGWPPWKEDRTAMDAEIGPEHGISRAGQILRHMQEAGYPVRDVDIAMMIHAGWDQDQTPTIQNRFSLPHSRNHHVGALDGLEPGEEKEPSSKKMVLSKHEIWAARIRATRTLEEAWACFVSYDSIDEPQNQCVYLAMLEKLAFGSRLQANEWKEIADLGDFFDSSRTTVVPGDGKEMSPTPENPHERLDPRLQLPTMEGFAEYMLAKGLAPSSRCLAFLIKKASSRSQAHRYIQSSRTPALLPLTASKPTTEEIQAVPELIFDAYVSFLCKSPRSTFTDPLAQAALLMKERRSLNSLLWNKILRSMLVRADALELKDPFPPYPHFRAIELVFDDMQKIHMQIEEETFISFCELFRKRVARQGNWSSGWNLLKLDNKGPMATFRFFDSILENFTGGSFPTSSPISGAISIKEFQTSISSVDRNSSGIAADDENLFLPTLRTTPTAWCLHSCVCALGFLHYQAALCAVTAFMLLHATQITAPLNQQTNGRLMMRHTIIAIRVFLERPWIPDFQSPEALINLARQRVERMPSAWGGWPSDEECKDYLDLMWPKWSSDYRRQAKTSRSRDGDMAGDVFHVARENLRTTISRELERLQLYRSKKHTWHKHLKLEGNIAD